MLLSRALSIMTRSAPKEQAHQTRMMPLASVHQIQINPPPPPPLSEKLTLIVVVDDDGRRSGSVGSRSPVVKAANHDQGWGRRSGTLSPAQAQERVRMRVGLGVGREDRVATAVHAQRRD